MHGLMVRVNIEPGREAEAAEFLKANVVPALKQSPGLVAAYWWQTSGGQGSSLAVFDSEEAARGAAAMASSGQVPMPEYVSMAGADVVEIQASI